MNRDASASAEPETGSPWELRLPKEDLARLRADIRALEEHLVSLGGGKTAEARAAADAGIETLRAELDRLTAKLGLRGHEPGRTLEEKVREQPVASLLAAFGLGFLPSRLLERR